jgi:glycosyltransferase involved in cell wall biosynthesis
MHNTSDICAIVCTLNSEGSISRVIDSIHASGIREVIVVDGNSSDRTASLAKRAGARVLFDEGTGLAAARAMGSAANRLPLTLFVGPDNVISAELVEKLLSDLGQSDNLVACGCLTKLEERTYVAQGITLVLQTLVRPGYAPTLGTPTLVFTHILRDFPYAQGRRFSDDTELFERIRRLTGKSLWVTDYEVVEIGTGSVSHSLARWNYYGISDFENFQAGKLVWSPRRKLQSILHPVRKQLLEPFLRVGPLRWFYFSPLFISLTIARYWGWFKEARQHAE